MQQACEERREEVLSATWRRATLQDSRLQQGVCAACTVSAQTLCRVKGAGSRVAATPGPHGALNGEVSLGCFAMCYYSATVAVSATARQNGGTSRGGGVSKQRAYSTLHATTTVAKILRRVLA